MWSTLTAVALTGVHAVVKYCRNISKPKSYTLHPVYTHLLSMYLCIYIYIYLYMYACCYCYCCSCCYYYDDEDDDLYYLESMLQLGLAGIVGTDLVSGHVVDFP